jgi:very-short-patch-repair endonuclease
MRDREETVTVLTDAHLAVIKELERRGVGLMEEVEFPPYRVDCYLPAYHAAIEVDGAQHSARADRKRDRELNAEYSLYVFHVSADNAKTPDKWLESLAAFLGYAQPTRDERWEACEMKTPWL